MLVCSLFADWLDSNTREHVTNSLQKLTKVAESGESETEAGFTIRPTPLPLAHAWESTNQKRAF
jgi:hypothetical protein